MGRYDHAARRLSKRTGRERGCWLYIPAEQLERAGFDLREPPPYFRTWNGRKGTILVQLYSDK